MAIYFFRVVGFLLALSTVGCAATGNYGSTARNGKVDRIFRAGAMPEEYQYFYYGWEQEPTAILGLSKQYTLRAKYWHEIDVTEQQVKKWRKYFIQSIGWYNNKSEISYKFEGYTLKDPQGKEVGILYSLNDWTVLQFPEKDVIVVYAPQTHGGHINAIPQGRER